MMKFSILTKVKLSKYSLLIGSIFTTSMSNVVHSVELPSDARGWCPNGYVNMVTEPYRSYTGQENIRSFRLPKNVCVRRYNSTDRSNYDTNFSVNQILPIDTNGNVEFNSINGSVFNINDYEPVVGHFNNTHTFDDVKDPDHPNYQDYEGAHPFLVAKNAHASIRLIDGKYLIDKQLRLVDGGASFCQNGFSTVGKTNACYFKKNRIILNSNNKAELQEPESFTPEKTTIGQVCPLGTATASNLGSHGGICTDNRILYSKKKLKTFGISVEQTRYCPPEEKLHGYVCIPIMTAFYCYDDLPSSGTGDLVATVSSRMPSSHFDFPSTSTFGSLSMQHLFEFQLSTLERDAENRFRTDYLFQSRTNPSRKIAVLHVFTEVACSIADLDRGSFSVEPLPPIW